MPQPHIPPPGPPQHLDRFRPELRRVVTENYSQRTDELARNWRKMISQSAFLTIKYGMIDAENELAAISRLNADWDSYGAEAPSPVAVDAAKAILETLRTSLILPTTIVPSAGGGISIYFLSGDRSAYIENYNDGTQALVMYDQQGATEVVELGPEMAYGDVGARISAHLD